MTTVNLPAPVVLEGHLRYAGDGSECSELYLDGQSLARKLPGYEPGRGEWVPAFADWDEPEAYDPANETQAFNLCHGYQLLVDGKVHWRCMLFADWGRVRITIEPLGDGE
jgi:hypothetical protein